MHTHSGFILTRQQRDDLKTHQAHIKLWISTPNGAKNVVINNLQPVFFIRQNDVNRVQKLLPQLQINPLTLSTFEHQPVSGCYSQTNKAHLQALETLKLADIVTYEGDIRLIDRYLMERFIYGGIEVYTSSTSTTLKAEHCKASDYQPTLTTVSLDIECSEKGILYSVGLDSEMDSRVIMVGEPQSSTDSHTPIQWVTNENELLNALETWFEQFDPDIIIGWNVINFDCQLLVKRAHWHNRPLNIGRHRQPLSFRGSFASQKSTEQQSTKQQSTKLQSAKLQPIEQQRGFVNLAGRVVLDGIDSLKTATFHFNSWSLESVAQELLGEGKDIDHTQDKMAEINRLYAEDKPALARYNLQDCRLVSQIFKHTHLLDFLIERSRLTGVELDRLGGSVAAFSNLYLPKLHRSGYIAPNLHPENWLASPGGYVMQSKPGLYQSVLVLDFKSLYPSIIRTFLIDPVGLVEGLKLEAGRDLNQAVEGFIGGQFHREKHHLPAIIEALWKARDQAKKNNEAAFSQAIKIIMNSFYGVLGSSGCRFFDRRLASSITLRGQAIMKQTQKLIEEQGFEVIYGDTDSIFVSLVKSQTDQQADHIGQQLVETINTWWSSHIEQEYQLPCHLELEYETHYKRFLMPTIRGSDAGSKKRYCGLRTQSNGEDVVIYKGLESARSDWTPLSQQFQQTLYRMVFEGDDPQDYIRAFAQKTLNGEHDDLLVYQKRLHRPLDHYQKNVPPQVRAARLADEHNSRLGRPLQYQNKGRIEYLFTLNGPEPKDFRESPIDYQHYLDKQIKPVANAILPFIELDFESIIAPQIGLF